ncbi:MAG: ATP-binding protein [Rhodospirillales bacterium]
MDPALAFALGVAAAAPLIVWQWGRMAGAGRTRRRISDEAEQAKAVMSTTPDGFFVWNLADGSETCSRRLAVLLDLPGGAGSKIDDILSRFEGDDLQTLEKAIEALRRQGEAFSLRLSLTGATRRVSVTGIRAGGDDGRPLADILWVGDADGAGNGPGPSEARYQALLDALPHPVWLRGADLSISYSNRACKNPEITEASAALAKRAKTEGRAVGERHLISDGDTSSLVEVTETPLNGLEGTAGFAIDLSRTEEMEGEFARHAEAHGQVLENLSTAIAIFGPQAKLILANQAYSRLWRLDPEWLALKPSLGEVLDRLREQRRLPEVADFKAFKKEQLSQFDGLSKPVEDHLHLPDGTTLRSVVSPHSMGGLVFTYEDVSDRLDLERSYNTLIAVQGETLDNLHEGVAVFGSDGRLKLNNPVFARLWNLEPEDLEPELHVSELVEKMRPLFPGDGDWGDQRDRIISRIISRQPSTGRLARKDGVILDYANVPLPDGAVLLSYMDVTDSAHVESALRQRAEALLEADRLKSEFIANVSYEVRTPMNTLIGFAEILTAEYFGELNPRQKDYSRGILKASRGLMSIIGDILDLATIEAGMMSLELDTVDLHSMLASVLNLTRERARRKNLNLEFDCPVDIGWMVADEKRLKQVLFNLLSNAVRFTPPGGRITLKAGRQDDSVVFIVSDTGTGIREGDYDRVFVAFERGETPQSNEGGAGLGLSLVKRFIELHGGSVEINSSPKRGTTVICRLPSGGASESQGGPG